MYAAGGRSRLNGGFGLRSRELSVCLHMLQGFRKCIKCGANGARPVDDMVFLVLDTQTDFVVSRLKHAQFIHSAVYRIQSQCMFILAVKITAGRMKTGPGKPVAEGFASQCRCWRGSFGGRRFFKPALFGVIAGNLYGLSLIHISEPTRRS